MKKIHILFATLLTVAGLASCDMEKYPYNAVEESLYMTTVNDFVQARVGLYSNFRALTTGTYVLLPDIQCDDFQAVAGFSNTYGNHQRWDFQTTDGNIESVWSSYYSTIARCNYFLDGYGKVTAGEVLTNITDAEMTEISTYAAEAYFVRAYCYYMLSTYFCQAYDPNTADSQQGLPLQLTYAPTSDASAYPGRSSLKATYDQIVSDLNNASDLWTGNVDKWSIYYVSPYSIQALQARVALNMKNYSTAISASTSLINASTQAGFGLVSDAEMYAGIWNADNGAETIWQIFMKAPSELGSATGATFWGGYLSATPEEQTMDYIPSQSLVDLYDQENDIRFAAFFTPFHLTTTTGTSGDIFVFNKYPGNPGLGNLTVDQHYTNMSKPLRTAEQYLIAAEAYLESGDEANATSYLNQLRSARIVGYENQTFSSAALRTAIRDERHKELVGEGYRLNDLKRWGLGFDRNGAEQDANVLQPGASFTGLNVDASNYRFTWPIPKAEMDMNPQLNGQQNPGY